MLSAPLHLQTIRGATAVSALLSVLAATPVLASDSGPGITSAAPQARSSGAKMTAESRSYAIGVEFARALRGTPVELDPGAVTRGVEDVLLGRPITITEEEIRTAVAELQRERKTRIIQARRQGADENRKAGDTFRARHRAQEGVTALPSGLQYKVLKAGTGATPSKDDTVLCHFRAKLVDGFEFDSSYSRGAPAAFPVSRVIRGWSEALQLMPVGSVWEVVMPPELAYGDLSSGEAIGPMSTLVYEIQLLSIEPASRRNAEEKPVS